MNRPKIVLVGAGRFGMNHLRVWKELEEEDCCTFVGVVDARLDVLEGVKKRFNVAVSPNVNGFLVDSVDAIDIVTPTDTHFSIGTECLNGRANYLFLDFDSYPIVFDIVKL